MLDFLMALFGYVRVPPEAVRLVRAVKAKVTDAEALRGLEALEAFLRSGRLLRGESCI